MQIGIDIFFCVWYNTGARVTRNNFVGWTRVERKKNYEVSLPEDYVAVKHVDAKSNKKQTIVYSLLSFVPLLIIMPVLCVVAVYCSGYDFSVGWKSDLGIVALLATCVAMFVYVVLHEIVHGITYKLLTGAKLTFGMTLNVAFCGVPNIFVRKKASVAALIMPFIVFTLIFAGMTAGLWFASPLYGVLSGLLLATHLGGCVGDLHWTLVYLTKFRRCNTLMRDTGPEQWLYIPKAEAEKYGIACVAVQIKKEKE